MPPSELRALYGRLGATDATLYLLDHVLRRVGGRRARLVRYRFVAQPVPESAQQALRSSSATVTRFVTADDPIVARFPRPARVIARRFKSGAQCLVIESKGEFAGFLWLALDHYAEDEVRCLYQLPHPQARAWDFDVYIEPRYRLGRSFARLWSAANDHLAAQGIRWSLSRISAFNPESLAAHRALGIREIGRATFVRLGRMQISFHGAAPFVHLGFSPSAKPRINLLPPEPTG